MANDNSHPEFMRGYLAGIKSVTDGLAGSNGQATKSEAKPRKSAWKSMSPEDRERIKAKLAAGRAKMLANRAARAAAKTGTVKPATAVAASK